MLRLKATLVFYINKFIRLVAIYFNKCKGDLPTLFYAMSLKILMKLLAHNSNHIALTNISVMLKFLLLIDMYFTKCG